MFFAGGDLLFFSRLEKLLSWLIRYLSGRAVNGSYSAARATVSTATDDAPALLSTRLHSLAVLPVV